MRFTRKKMIGLLVGIVSLGMAAAAFAYWTGGGSGTASASTATDTSAVTVNQTLGITGIDDLYPGGPAVALSGTFDNPNSGPVYIASVTATVDEPANGCTAGDFEITGTATVDAQIPSGNAQGSWSGLSVAMKNLATDQDVCKNTPVTITYTASAS